MGNWLRFEAPLKTDMDLLFLGGSCFCDGFELAEECCIC
jgi:hypothetical protein